MAKQKITLPDNLEAETYDWLSQVLAYLKKNDKFNVIDNGALRMLCTSYNTYVKAAKQLDKEGLTVTSDRGNVAKHPCFDIMKSAINNSMDILRDFGLTLKSRSRLNLINSETEESPLMQFLAENK